MSTEALGTFLREVSNWDWEEFVKAEHDLNYSSNDSMIFALIRSCAMEKMDAIRIALNRLDGKLKTPIKVEYPKFFYQYPYAILESPESAINLPTSRESGSGAGDDKPQTSEIAIIDEPEVITNDLPTLSLRQTLTKMSEYPRELPQKIVKQAEAIEVAVRGQGEMPVDMVSVKSVVAAHLLAMAQSRDISALSEVFDQIDGKLVETLQILGQDLYITSYSTNAPAGAYLNKHGVVEAEAIIAQDMWANKLGRDISGK